MEANITFFDDVIMYAIGAFIAGMILLAYIAHIGRAIEKTSRVMDYGTKNSAGWLFLIVFWRETYPYRWWKYLFRSNKGWAGLHELGVRNYVRTSKRKRVRT